MIRVVRGSRSTTKVHHELIRWRGEKWWYEEGNEQTRRDSFHPDISYPFAEKLVASQPAARTRPGGRKLGGEPALQGNRVAEARRRRG